jgi:hypothetical protein
MPRRLADLGASSITVESHGGLGNQLFIFSYALRLLEETALPVTLDLSHHQLKGARKFELRPYIPNAVMKYKNVRLGTSPVTQSLLRISLSTRTARFDPRITHETSLAFDPKLLHVRAGARIRAYVQSWRYLPSDTSLLNLVWTQPNDDRQKADCQDLPKRTGAVAVHVRRGDYTAPRARRSHPLLAQDYYGAALSLIRERFGSLTPVVFSDSPGEAIEIVRRLPLGKNAVIAPQTSSPIQTIRALSSLDALVMSNSTFSWWAAWRVGFSSNRIVAPRLWSNRPDFIWEDLIPNCFLQTSSL